MTAHFLNLLRARCPGLLAEPITIFEIGSRDAREALSLVQALPYAHVYSFEPNPATLPLALRNTALEPRVRVIGAAVTLVDGEIDFYSSLTGNNPGCSSVFPASGKYDSVEPMPAKKVRVLSVRVDTFLERFKDVKPPTFVWSDAQGSDLNALKSFGKHLDAVKAVWTEVLFDSLYTGQNSRDDLVNYLQSRGLALIYESDGFRDRKGKRWWADACFYRETK